MAKHVNTAELQREPPVIVSAIVLEITRVTIAKIQQHELALMVIWTVIAMEILWVQLHSELPLMDHKMIKVLVHVNALMAGREPIAILDQHVTV
jgi:hypothetical protein